MFEDKWCGEGRTEEAIPMKHERFSQVDQKWFPYNGKTYSIVNPDFVYKIGKRIQVENFDFELDFSRIGRTGIYFWHEPLVAIAYGTI